MFTVTEVPDTEPAIFAPSESISTFPPIRLPPAETSSSAPEEFISRAVVPNTLPPFVTDNPFISSVVLTPETVPDTVIALLFVFMPRIVSEITEPDTFKAPDVIFTEFPTILFKTEKSFPYVFIETVSSPVTSPPRLTPSPFMVISVPDTAPVTEVFPVESISTLPPWTFPVIFVSAEEFRATEVVPVTSPVLIPAPSTETSVPAIVPASTFPVESISTLPP